MSDKTLTREELEIAVEKYQAAWRKQSLELLTIENLMNADGITGHTMLERVQKLFDDRDRMQHELDQAEELCVRAGTPGSNVVKSIEMLIAQRDELREKIADFVAAAEGCDILRFAGNDVGFSLMDNFLLSKVQLDTAPSCPAIVALSQVNYGDAIMPCRICGLGDDVPHELGLCINRKKAIDAMDGGGE